MLDSKRTDLLAYLQDYSGNTQRWVGHLDKWRLRRWHRSRIASTAESVAAEFARLGVQTGHRVGIHATDGPLWLAGFFGTLRCGAVAVPIDSTSPAEMAVELASSVGLKAWVQDGDLPDLHSDLPTVQLDWQRPLDTPGSSFYLPPLPRDDPDRLAEVVLTSGTSSDPRSVPVTHTNLRAVLDGLEAEIHAYRWAVRLAPTLHVAVALPLSHLYGQVMGAFLPALLSADVSFVETMPAADLAAALRRQSTWVLATVPHTLAKLGRHLMDVGERTWGASGMERRLQAAQGMPWYRRWKLFDPVRRELGRRFIGVVSGGAELDAATENLWRRLGYLVIQGYGLTEAAPLVTLNHPFRPSAGTVGKPLPGIEVKLGGTGEILVRGNNVTSSDDGDARVDARGWLHTGDLGELDDSGNIRFVGRESDRVVTAAGMNIDVARVTAELRRQPAIVDAAVMERPWGSRGAICAVLVLRPGAVAQAAVQAANAHLPDVARVRRWFIWPGPDLPRTATGKPRRGLLLEWLRHQNVTDESSPGASVTGANTAEIICRRVAEIAELDLRQVDLDAPLGELLDSLQRVELAASVEQIYGLTPNRDLFAGLLTTSQLVEGLRSPDPRLSDAPQEQFQGHQQARGQERDPGRKDAPRGTALTHASPLPATFGGGPTTAEWRYWRSTRAIRWLLREGLVRPSLAGCLRVRSAGLENLVSLAPPFLVACNHVSILDPLVLLKGMPGSLRYRLAPAAMWQHFVEHPKGAQHYRWGVLGLNLFPLIQVGDWRPSLRIAGRLADHGYCPLIFPEGRRSDDGRPGRFHLGVTVLSEELHLPIVPCATAGLHAAMPIGCRWPKREALRRPTVAICFGEPTPTLRRDADRLSAVRDLEVRIAGLHRQALALSGRE